MARPAATVAVALLLLALALPAAQAQQLTIKSAERKINLKSQVVKVTDTLELSASGGAAKEALFCWPQRLADRLARIRVTVDKDAKPEAARAPAPAGAPAGASCFSAAVQVPKGKSVSVEVSASFTGVMAPNPKRILQEEKQMMEYEDTLYLLSPYPISSQTTTVLLPTTEAAASFSPKDKGADKDGKIVFEKLGAAKPWDATPMRAHFHHDKQFKKVVRLVREIEVSHWGNIYVEESYVIANAGAEHKGAFSRLRYAHSPAARANSFQALRARLPASAHSLYYKDLIGNVSSSDTRHGPKDTVVDLRLRYPLMGGWKADFVLGYSLPLSGFLFGRPKGRTRLVMDLGSPIEDVVVEELETRVVLPEGASRIEHTLPFKGVEASTDKKHTYLDTAGRPVLVLRANNLTPAHSGRAFAVDYSFGAAAMLREPLLLVLAFAALFAAAAGCNRLELTLSKDEAYLERRARERASATLSALAAAWDEEAEAAARLASTAEAVTDAVGADAAADVRHDCEVRLRAAEARARPLLAELEATAPKMAATAREHAERGKALQQRALRLLADKSDLARKGVPASEAAKRTAAAARAFEEARAEFVKGTVALTD